MADPLGDPRRSQQAVREDEVAPAEEEASRMGELGGALDPDHPLLARAQRALKRQLEANKLRLDEELREKNIMLNVRRIAHFKTYEDSWSCLLSRVCCVGVAHSALPSFCRMQRTGGRALAWSCTGISRA